MKFLFRILQNLFLKLLKIVNKALIIIYTFILLLKYLLKIPIFLTPKLFKLKYNLLTFSFMTLLLLHLIKIILLFLLKNLFYLISQTFSLFNQSKFSVIPLIFLFMPLNKLSSIIHKILKPNLSILVTTQVFLKLKPLKESLLKMIHILPFALLVKYPKFKSNSITTLYKILFCLALTIVSNALLPLTVNFVN
jgi:hypothetical protein